MAASLDPPPPAPPPGLAARRLRHALVALGALALAWALAHALADRDSVRERLRERATALLQRRLPAARLGDEVAVDWLFRATVGPLTVPAGAPGAPPVLRVDRVKVRAAWWPLLSGRIEPASIRLYGVRVVPGPGGAELERLVTSLRAPHPASAAAGAASPRGQDPVLHVRGLTVALSLGARQVELGPCDLRLERRRGDGEELIAAELGLPRGGRGEATLRRSSRARTGAAAEASGPGAPSGAGAASWALSASLHATAADLPDVLRRRAVVATAGDLAISLEAAGAPAGATATLRGLLGGLTLAGEALGPEPVGPLDVAGEADLELSWRDRRLRIRRAALRPAGPLEVQVAGALTATGDLPFDLLLTMPPVSYRALLLALPPALAPGADAPRPPGAFGGTLALSGALRRPEGWEVKGEVDLAGLREAARAAPPSPLRAPFTAHPEGEDGPAVLIGPANPDFVPLASLPEHVVRAVTTSEDAGFFGHRGFDFDELRNALAAGARAGKLLRGGSTISQQLAKNLYLSRDRTLARKVREALVTVALEGTVPKARLLEIYLNLVEWGPGRHGLGAAARHYLAKEARDLTPREACFLAALIPSPLRGHAAVAAGVPPERWAARIDDLLQKLHATGVLSDEALLAALAEPLVFAPWVPRRALAPGAAPPPEGEEPDGDGPGADGTGGALAEPAEPAEQPSGG
ncbi:MAG: transglycosylase domain-containing protein [Anaeromyxobacter sp.]|nr:transglycosylase domain-containing protein [Anaeromyxobacter sp.]MBL0276045.1 transglycosylase domain-containing protein [Anaeromyxobacter sp.]